MTQSALFRDGKTGTGILVPLDSLRRAWGLPGNATASEIAAAMQSRDALPESQRKRPVNAASKASTTRPSVRPKAAPAKPAVESHEDFMRRMFPGVPVDQAPDGVESLSVSAGSTGGEPARGVAAGVPGPEAEHQQVMAQFFPEVGRGPFQSRRARIQSFS